MDTKLLDCTGLQMVMRRTQRAVAYIALVPPWLVGTIVLHIAANTALLQQLVCTVAPAAGTAAVLLPIGTAAVLLGIDTVVVVCAALQVAELMSTAWPARTAQRSLVEKAAELAAAVAVAAA